MRANRGTGEVCCTRGARSCLGGCSDSRVRAANGHQPACESLAQPRSDSEQFKCRREQDGKWVDATCGVVAAKSLSRVHLGLHRRTTTASPCGTGNTSNPNRKPRHRCCVLVAGVVLLRGLLRHRRKQQTPRPSPHAEWFARLVTILGTGGFKPTPGETPLEFATRAAVSLRKNAATVEVAEVPLDWVEAYYESRFGDRPFPQNRRGATLESRLGSLDRRISERLLEFRRLFVGVEESEERRQQNYPMFSCPWIPGPWLFLRRAK